MWVEDLVVYICLFEKFYNYLINGLNFDSAVDFGCGRNIFIELVKQKGKLAIGLDTVRIDRDTVVGDVLKAPFKKNEFDLIFSSMVIEHMEDPYKFMAELSRVSKKYCIIVTLKPSDSFWNDPDHKRPYTKKALLRLFNFSGFKPVKIFDFPFINEIAIVGKKIN